MISRRAIVLLVLVAVLVVGVITGFVLTKPKPAPEPAECYCPDGQECNSAGECIPDSQCGPKSIPPGQHCSMDKLYCDPLTSLWRCNGNCDSGWEGEMCICPSSTKPVITDVCQGQLPFCQTDGTWKNGAAQNCNDVNVFLKDIAKVQPDSQNPSRPLSDVYCNTGQCKGVLTCQQPQGVVQMVCQKQCKGSPRSGECGKTSDSGPINCGPTESCLCDITTDYEWECKQVYNPSSAAGCPPDPPQKYCKDQSGADISPLPCTPCYLNGNDGFIRYCPGSGMFPLECVSSKYGLYNTQMPTQGSTVDSTVTFAQSINLSPPVYPSIDNVLCKQGQQASTKLQDDLDYIYKAVGNPNGNVVYAGNDPSKRSGETFVPFDPGHHYYYNNSQDPTSVNCLWDDAPTCSGSSRGKFIQWCTESGKKVPCDYNKWSTQIRTNTGYCDCSVGNYNSLTPPASAKHYKGDQCQYDDNTSCSSHGSVKDDGTCDCLPEWFGAKCENNIRGFCSGHGSYNSTSSACVCDADWFGDRCENNVRDFCSGHGTFDKNKGICVCDTEWFGDRCETDYFFIAIANVPTLIIMTWDPETKTVNMKERNTAANDESNVIFKFTAESNGYVKIKCLADKTNFLHWNGLFDKELTIGKATPGLADNFTDFKIVKNNDGSFRLECREKIDNLTYTVVWSPDPKGKMTLMTVPNPNRGNYSYPDFRLVYDYWNH